MAAGEGALNGHGGVPRAVRGQGVGVDLGLDALVVHQGDAHIHAGVAFRQGDVHLGGVHQAGHPVDRQGHRGAFDYLGSRHGGLQRHLAVLVGLSGVHGLDLCVQGQLGAGEQLPGFLEGFAHQVGNIRAAPGDGHLHNVPGSAGAARVGGLGENGIHGLVGHHLFHHGQGEAGGLKPGNGVNGGGAGNGGHLLGRGPLGYGDHHRVPFFQGGIHFRRLEDHRACGHRGMVHLDDLHLQVGPGSQALGGDHVRAQEIGHGGAGDHPLIDGAAAQV